MKKEYSAIWRLRSLLVIALLCLAQAAHGETFEALSLPGPVKLKVLWLIAAVGFIFVISRKQKRAGNRL